MKDGTKCWFVTLDEVRLVEADGNYVRLYWREHVPMLQRTMSALEARLEPSMFFRASRKHIVNLAFIESVEAAASGQLSVKLRGSPDNVEISRRQAKAFRALTGG